MSTQPARVRVGDLPDLLGSPFPHPLLYCAECDAECSAHRGDYWFLDDDEMMECECGAPLELMRRRSFLERVA